MQFFELPEVEMASRTSPGRPRASTWRSKMWSKEWSLPTAVRMLESVVRAPGMRVMWIPYRTSWSESIRLQASLSAKVRVVARNPVLTRRGKDVEVDGVFEGLGGVGQVAGDDEDVARTDDLVDG